MLWAGASLQTPGRQNGRGRGQELAPVHTLSLSSWGLCPLQGAASRWVLARPTSCLSREEHPLFPHPTLPMHAQLGLLKGVHPGLWAGSWAPPAPGWAEHLPHPALPSLLPSPTQPEFRGPRDHPTQSLQSSHSHQVGCPGSRAAPSPGQAPAGGEAEWQKAQAGSGGPGALERPLWGGLQEKAGEQKG